MTHRLADRGVTVRSPFSSIYDKASGFRCVNCRQFVSLARQLSGVGNRNHCPYCLHSRHLDWQRAGDRLAACKGNMQPVSLTFKHIDKRYGEAKGELMIVHRCKECGKLSINRIAADDDRETMLVIFGLSQQLDARVRADMDSAGIQSITTADLPGVYAQLFGKN